MSQPQEIDLSPHKQPLNIDNLEIHHVPREQNKRADELANIALDS